MNGRLEKELSAEKKMQEKLKTLPKIFSDYYVYLRAAKKTYTTIGTYMNYVVHFAKYLGDDKIKETFEETSLKFFGVYKENSKIKE